MAASNQDLLTQATNNSRPSPTQVTSVRTGGGTTLAVNALTGWPTNTAVHFITYKIDTSGNKIAGTQIDMKGVVSGTNITQIVIKAGTDGGNGIGDVVEASPTAAWANDVVAWGTAHANQDGSLITTAVQNALGITTPGGNGWTIIPYTATYGANNGNKEFTVTYPLDLTSTLSAGMKMQHTRGTTAPTQSMAFTAASSQYASKTTPTGITFTAAFTCEAWVYLNSYTGSAMNVSSRFDGTNGFILQVQSTGQVLIASNGNTSYQNSYRVIPLKRWVHIAGTFNAGTFNVYINGELVPSVRTGSATAVTQAGNLQVGAANGTGFFDGYISEARIWSVAQTQTQIQNNMAISLTGSETNLVALFQGNGNFNDKTANANNLTSSGGAIATQLANPYNNIEYAEVVNVTYGAPNTTVVLNTGDYCNIPNMALTNPQYSTAANPFGCPADITGASVRRQVLLGTAFSTSATTATQIPGLTTTITLPASGRKVKIKAYSPNSALGAAANIYLTLWRGAVGAGQQLESSSITVAGSTFTVQQSPEITVGESSGSVTYNVGLHVSANTGTVNTVPTSATYLSIEPA